MLFEQLNPIEGERSHLCESVAKPLPYQSVALGLETTGREDGQVTGCGKGEPGTRGCKLI